MERVIKEGNTTKYYLDDRLLISIEELGDNSFKVENLSDIMTGFYKNLDEHHGEYRLDKCYDKKKNKNLRRNSGMFKHNTQWFTYILEEKGFVKKLLPVR